MIGIVIVGHGGLAKELLGVMEHVYGPQEAIRTVSIGAEDDRDSKQMEVCAAADAVDAGAGVIVITDVSGGSPSNLSLPACQLQNRRFLSGANVPMLLTLAKYRKKDLQTAVEAAYDAGRKYIRLRDLSDEGEENNDGSKHDE